MEAKDSQHILKDCKNTGEVQIVLFTLIIIKKYFGSADSLFDLSLDNPREGGGGTPLYKLYRYVPPQRVWFLSRFGLKTGIDFEITARGPRTKML